MKQILFSCFLFAATFGFAQTDLSIYSGYQFGAKNYGYNGTLRLKGNVNYGAMLEVGLRPDLMIQLQYMYSPTYATLERGFESIRGDVNVNYYQLGFIRPFPINQNVEAFGNFSMGATNFAIQELAYNDEWRFSVTLGLGAKIWLSDVVGIRLQARMLAPINWGGLGFFCGTGGCDASYNVGSSFVSGDVSGGLIFRLKE